MIGQTIDVFEYIGSNYHQFTASEKKIADYVLKKRQEVQYMSISEFAEETGVSEATISRFCKSLGMRSYSEFKLEIAKAVANVSMETYESSDTDHANLVSKLGLELINSYTSSLRQSVALAKEEDYEKALELLINARMVICMGQGGSMIIAQEAAHVMTTVSPKFFAVSGSHVQTVKISQLGESDVILFFSYSGSTREITELISLAKERGTKVILVTRFVKSPGAKIADVILPCGSDEGPLQISSMPSMIASLIVIDILYREYCSRCEKDTTKRREMAAKAISELHL